MNIFDDIILEWKGRDYRIPSNKVMGAIARIEEIITLTEIGAYGARGGVPVAKLSMAYGTVLRYAGAVVTDEEIYGYAISQQQQGFVTLAVQNILTIMLPSDARAEVQAAIAAAGDGSGDAAGGAPGSAIPIPPGLGRDPSEDGSIRGNGEAPARIKSQRGPIKRQSARAG